MNRQSGQATVELIAAIPLLALAAAVAVQLLLGGYALTLADGAAEAGSLALASGRSARRAAKAALPGWAAERAKIAVRGGEVTVRLEPPAPTASLAAVLTASSSSYARPAGR
jgi:hypothetical protein